MKDTENTPATATSATTNNEQLADQTQTQTEIEPGKPLATMRRDRLSGYWWLEFPGKPTEAVRAALKATGWRWGSKRGQWFNRGGLFAGRVSAEISAVYEIEDGGECDYAGERAERLEERAESHQAKSNQAHDKFRSIHDGIPFGQPILVGHHSERRHRRDLDRAGKALDTAITESRTASHLQQAANSSRHHQQHLQSAATIARRIERLEAELRKREKVAAKYHARPVAEAVQAEWDRATDLLKAEIERNRQALADAGGLPGDQLAEQLRVGQIVQARCYGTVKIGRINHRKDPATGQRVFNSISGQVVDGPTRGWKVIINRTDLLAILTDENGQPWASLKQDNQPTTQREEQNNHE